MDHEIPDKLYRTLYFGIEISVTLALTCFILEFFRYLCKEKKSDQLPSSSSEPFLSRVASWNFSSRDLDDTAGQKMYNVAFGIYYVFYQVLLYVVMDYGVAHGLMNFITGIAWELWMPFIQFVCVTALVTGIPWYIRNRGNTCVHPSQLLAVQLAPLLGNEIHIMKDHIAQALCFVCAHCQDRTLRQVGLVLGYLSLAATFVPVMIMFADKKSSKTLRASHWPIPEAPFMVRVEGKNKKEKLYTSLVETAINSCTEDKLKRALIGEVPHSVIHFAFAYFFGGGVFIVSAIVLSVVKILAIPFGRLRLQTKIAEHGCSQTSLDRYLTYANKIRWDSAVDAIKCAIQNKWVEPLQALIELAPEFSPEFFVAPQNAFEVNLSDVPTTTKDILTNGILDKIRAFMNELDSENPSILIYSQGGTKIRVREVKDIAKVDEGDFPLRIVFDEEKVGDIAMQKLLVQAFEQGQKQNPKDQQSGVDHYLEVLRVFHDQLAFHDEKAAERTVDMVFNKQIPMRCLDYLEKITKIGNKQGMNINDYVHAMARSAAREHDESEMAAALESAAKRLDPPGGDKKETRASRDHEDSDGEGSRREKAEHGKNTRKYVLIVSVCIPCLLWVFLMLATAFSAF